MHHDPVQPAVHPTGIPVLGDSHVHCADITPAVAVIEMGHREFQHVDIIAGFHVLVDRGGFDYLRRDPVLKPAA